MPMTAAERQKRYRDRLKQTKARLEGERERFERELRKSFVSSGIRLLQLHGDEAARAALLEFMRISEIDIVRIMENAGKNAALALYERELVHRMAAPQQRAVYGRELRAASVVRRIR